MVKSSRYIITIFFKQMVILKTKYYAKILEKHVK